MPLTKKGAKIMRAMKETYGDDEAERVFYASANAGKITGVHKAKDALIAVTDADGCLRTHGAHLADNDTLLDAVTKHRDGYLTCEARVARTGTQRYRGHEVGMPDREHVTLLRPESEVFARDSMRSMANKPITLTHPKQMVDARSWSKVAKGFSGSDVVRDGEYVRVPLMLTDAAAIEAFEKGEARELSVGYTTDIDWAPGETADGVAYDGVQRLIRGNHHALVPAARGGESLRFGDAGIQYESQGAGLTTCPNCDAKLTGHPMSCSVCGYDLKPTSHSGEKSDMGDFDPDQPRGDDGKWTASSVLRPTAGSGGGDGGGGGEPHETLRERNRRRNVNADIDPEEYDDNDQNWQTTAELMQTPLTNPRTGAVSSQAGKEPPAPINVKLAPGQEKNYRMDASASDNAASRGIAGEEGVMPIIKNFDGIPISFADEVSAAAMEREFRNMQQRLADAGSDNFGGKKAKPFGKKGNGNGDDDDVGDQDADAIEAKRRKVTAEDALKRDVEAKDGEIAVLKKQLADAAMSDAKIEALAAERIAVLDAAKPFLPKDFKDAGKTLAEIRRATVATSFSDAEMKDWTDDQVVGAFRTMVKVQPHKGGASALADGMSAGMRANAGGYQVGGMSLSDAQAEAEKSYNAYVKNLGDAYKNPISAVRN